MTDSVVIRVCDLRRYLDVFSDEAVVLREIGDAQVEGAYVDLDVAMRHLEQEHGGEEIANDGSEHDPEDEDDYENEIEAARALTTNQERSIAAWERAQD